MSSTRPSNQLKESYKTQVKALVKAWSKVLDNDGVTIDDIGTIFALSNADTMANAIIAFESSVRIMDGEFKAEQETTHKELADSLAIIPILTYQLESISNTQIVNSLHLGTLISKDVNNTDEKLLASMYQMLNIAAEQSGQTLPSIQLPPANPRFGFSSATSSTKNSSPTKLNFKHYVPMPADSTAEQREQIAREMEEKEKSIAPKIMREIKELVEVCCTRWSDLKMRIITTALLKSDLENLIKLAPTFKKIEAFMNELKRHNETSFFELRSQKEDFITHGDKIKLLISSIDKMLQEIQKVKPITIMDSENKDNIKRKLEEYNKAMENAYKTFESTIAAKSQTMTNNNNTNSNSFRK